jgi:hypothetical protein
MCRAFLASLVFLPLAVGYSQTQERKIMDRVLKPDMKQSSIYEGKLFQPSDSLAGKTASVSEGVYDGSKKAYVKDFAFTRSFLGIRNPWFGGKVYEVRTAGEFASAGFHGADRDYATRATVARGFYQEDKKAQYGSPVVPVSPYTPNPAAPGAVNQITEKVKKEMTIDDVRQLLNKGH